MFNLILLWWRMKKNSSNGNYFKFILFLGVAIIVYALGFMDIDYRGFANIDLLNYRQSLVILGSALFLGGLIGGLIVSSQSTTGKESDSSIDIDGNVEIKKRVVSLKKRVVSLKKRVVSLKDNIQFLCDKFFLSDKVSNGVSGKKMLLINVTLLSIVLCLVSISADVSILFLLISFFTAISPYFIRKNIKVSSVEEFIWIATSFTSTFLLVINLIPFIRELFF